MATSISRVHVWKPQRKLLNPTFNNKILLSFIPIFNERSRVLVDTLEKKLGEKPFDISKQFLACTLEMVCATTIGYDVGFQGSKNVELLGAMESQSALIANRKTKFWLHPEWIYKWTDDYKNYQRGTSVVYDIPSAIRKRKLLEFDENFFKNHKELEEEEFFSSPQIFINELLKLHHKKQIDIQTIDDQIVTVLVGGNETSALSMSSIMLMLAMHPEIQEKAFQEIKDVHETQTSPSDFEILAKLEYLEMCIKGAMRLFPVAPFLGRQNMEDIKLSNCTIPK